MGRHCWLKVGLCCFIACSYKCIQVRIPSDHTEREARVVERLLKGLLTLNSLFLPSLNSYTIRAPYSVSGRLMGGGARMMNGE